MQTQELKFGLIGSSLSHSKSINIQNAAFEYLKVNAIYENYEIEKNNFEREIIQLLQEVNGLNITIPYKEKILKYLNRSNELVKKIGAANTVHVNEMGITGFNTDYFGFLESLKPIPNIKEIRPTLIGAGGAAKALIYALRDIGIKQIDIYARNPIKVEQDFENSSLVNLEIKTLRNDIDLKPYNLVINCTPIGQGRLSHETPLSQELLSSLEKNSFIYDLIYSDTRLLQEAREIGLQTINGKDMLIWQAIYAIQHWLDIEADQKLYDVMSEAF